MNAVSLLHAEAGSTPSGTGSFSYFSNFFVVVENLAFDKLLGIWGRDASSGNWSFHPCSFSRSVPGNLEVWTGSVGSPMDQFDVEYQAAGSTFWDNNNGFNYSLSTDAAQGTDGVGTAVINPNVLAVEWATSGGNLAVDVLVKNVAFTKQVAIVYTTDHWATFHNAFATFSQSFPPPNSPHQLNAELWTISAPLGAAATGQFAAFYNVAGTTYWDNNFGLDYSF